MKVGRRRKRRTIGEMGERKWEDLNQDCLMNIFRRLGMKSLLLDVLFVCKSWHKATHDPGCWHRLDFSEILTTYSYFKDAIFPSRFMNEYEVKGKFNITGLIKCVVKRSDRSATFLILPDFCTREILLYVADECPHLKTLELPYPVYASEIPKLVSKLNLVSKWKNLEFLTIGICFQFREILTQINIHCKNFVGLTIKRNYIVGKDAVLAIITLLPNIKHLSLWYCFMEKKNLVMILQGCKELVHFEAMHCTGFNEGDYEILKLTSHMCTFKVRDFWIDDDAHEARR
ncbi:hypothetical protein U1Q18_030701 [Sarracenia purpurea var. burkii]